MGIVIPLRTFQSGNFKADQVGSSRGNLVRFPSAADVAGGEDSPVRKIQVAILNEWNRENGLCYRKSAWRFPDEPCEIQPDRRAEQIREFIGAVAREVLNSTCIGNDPATITQISTRVFETDSPARDLEPLIVPTRILGTRTTRFDVPAFLHNKYDPVLREAVYAP